MDSSHTPRFGGRSGAMTGSPGSHSTIVHLAKGPGGDPSSLGDGRNTGYTRILGVKPGCIGGGAAPGSLVGLERFVRFRILPGHLGAPGDLTMTLCLASCRESAIVLGWPQHCISALKSNGRLWSN